MVVVTGDLVGDEGLGSQPGPSWSGGRKAPFPPRGECVFVTVRVVFAGSSRNRGGAETAGLQDPDWGLGALAVLLSQRCRRQDPQNGPRVCQGVGTRHSGPEQAGAFSSRDLAKAE